MLHLNTAHRQLFVKDARLWNGEQGSRLGIGVTFATGGGWMGGELPRDAIKTSLEHLTINH